VAISNWGSVYIASQSATITELLYADMPSLNFGSTGLNQATNDMAVSLENFGNVDLAITNTSFGTTTAYLQDSTTSCPALTGTLAAGANCAYQIYFDPTATSLNSNGVTGEGPYNFFLTITDNSDNATGAIQSIPLSGTGLAAQTASFAATFASPVPYTTGLTESFAISGSNVTNAINVTVTGPATPYNVSSIGGSYQAGLNITGVGTVTVSAYQIAGNGYAQSPTISQSFTVTQNSQVITFPTINAPGTAEITFSGTTPVQSIGLGATSSAGTAYPVVYSIVSGPGSISGNNLLINGAGTIIVAANQPGDANYTAAAQVTQSLVVDKAAQVITDVNFAAGTIPTSVVYQATPQLTYTLSAYGSATAGTADSGNPVTFTMVSGPGLITAQSAASCPGSLEVPCTATLTITGVGTVVIAENQQGNNNWAAAPTVTYSIQVTKAPQAIGFPAPTTPVVWGTANGTSQTITVTSNSNEKPITFSVTGPATTSAYGCTWNSMTLVQTCSDTLTFNGVGTVTINANQAGDANYQAAPTRTRDIVITQAPQAIGFPAPTTPVVWGTANGTSQTITVTSNSNEKPITFSVTGPATTSAYTCDGATPVQTCSDTLTFNGVGTVTINANQAGDANYQAAPTRTRDIVITQAQQTITALTAYTGTWSTGEVTLPQPVTYSPNFQFNVKAKVIDQVNPVTFMVTGPGYIVPGSTRLDAAYNEYHATINVTGVGTITVTANQAGNNDYVAAPTAVETIVVNQATQTLGFPAPSSPVVWGTTLGTTQTITVTGGASGNPVTFTVTGPASTSGYSFDTTTNTATTTLTFTGVGTVTINADQAGNSDYQAAPERSRNIVVTQASQTVAFTAPNFTTISPIVYNPAVLTYSVAATGGASGNPVTVTVLSGPGTISGTALTITGVGTIVVAANQEGNLDYAAAPQATETLVVTQATQSINFTPLVTLVHFPGDPNLSQILYAVDASNNNSGNPITFTVLSGPGVISTYTPPSTGVHANAVNSTEQLLTITGVGTVIIAANQAGNLDYAAAPQVTQSIEVDPSPDFTISASPTPLTVSDGNLITTVVTVTPLNGFNSVVTLSCSGLPAGISCSFAPATVTPNGGTQTPEGGTASSILTITAASGGATASNSGSRPFLPLTSLAVALCFFGFRKRRNLLMMLLLAVSFVGMAMVTGCGGVSNSSSTSTTSSITVTGTATTPEGTVTHSTTFLLTVN
jgi:hypothetical protein